jgi:hypothetical protein
LAGASSVEGRGREGVYVGLGGLADAVRSPLPSVFFRLQG